VTTVIDSKTKQAYPGVSGSTAQEALDKTEAKYKAGAAGQQGGEKKPAEGAAGGAKEPGIDHAAAAKEHAAKAEEHEKAAMATDNDAEFTHHMKYADYHRRLSATHAKDAGQGEKKPGAPEKKAGEKKPAGEDDVPDWISGKTDPAELKQTIKHLEGEAENNEGAPEVAQKLLGHAHKKMAELQSKATMGHYDKAHEHEQAAMKATNAKEHEHHMKHAAAHRKMGNEAEAEAKHYGATVPLNPAQKKQAAADAHHASGAADARSKEANADPLNPEKHRIAAEAHKHASQRIGAHPQDHFTHPDDPDGFSRAGGMSYHDHNGANHEKVAAALDASKKADKENTREAHLSAAQGLHSLQATGGAATHPQAAAAVRKQRDSHLQKVHDIDQKEHGTSHEEIMKLLYQGPKKEEDKTEKSISGKDTVMTIEEYLEKSQGLPKGEPKLGGNGDQQGGELAGVGKASGAHDSAPGKEIGAPVPPTKKLSEDDEDDEAQMKPHKKPIETAKSMSVPQHQRDMVAREHAAVVSRLRKGDPDVVVSGAGLERSVVEPPEAEQPKSWNQGPDAMVAYSDSADRAAEQLAKSGGFYHGGAPSIPRCQTAITQTVECPECHGKLSKALSECPECGAGARMPRFDSREERTVSTNGRRGNPLRPARVQDVYLPRGLKTQE
jgi:hypothetical protein